MDTNTSKQRITSWPQWFVGLLFILSTNNLKAQNNVPSEMWLAPITKDFETIRDSVNRYYFGRSTERGTGYKQWKRWEAFNETRLDSNGQIVNVGALNYEAYLRRRPAQSSQRNQDGDWHAWSATEYTNGGSWSPGIGRVNDVAFHPTDPNTIFVATPAGGVFKTTNNGQSWTCLTQILGNLGCSGIVINPSDPNNMFILTGDGDGQNTRSIGVYVTFDGGTLWLPTALTWGLTDEYYARKIVMEPGFPSWMMVASKQGIWQTINSGSNWSSVLGGEIFDIEYHPSNTSIVYASTANKLYKSTNWGQTWTEKYTISGATRIEIAVSPDDESKVYLFAGPSHPYVTGPDTTFGFKGLHVSNNSGETFILDVFAPNILSHSITGTGLAHQTTYDLAIAADPANASTVFMGGVNVWKYNASNSSLVINAHWELTSNNGNQYVHADIHDLAYSPLNGYIYAATDGGIFYSTNSGTTWIDLTEGLNISQLYHIAGTPQDPNKILGGLQDNGTALFNQNNSMTTLLGADGGDVLINPTNTNILYAMTQEGNVRRSTNGGVNFSSIKPAGSQKGPFVTRWDIDPNTPTTIRMGWTNDTVYTTNNSGTSWSKVKLPGGGNKNVRSISVAGNSTTIYAVTTTKAFVTTNSGMTWTEFDQANGPSGFTSITAHPTIPTIAFYTEGGFGSLSGRVMIYNNGSISEVEGTSAFSGELPEVPVNVVISRLKNGIVELYAGTDIGVYHFTYEDTDAGWTPFKEGLPNVIVNDLVIHQTEGIIRAGTFGRGIWESDLWHECEYELNLTQANDPDQGTPVFQYHEARNLLTSNRWIIGSNGDVTYKSKDLVILSNGFRATEGNKVLVGLKPCGQTLE